METRKLFSNRSQAGEAVKIGMCSCGHGPSNHGYPSYKDRKDYTFCDFKFYDKESKKNKECKCKYYTEIEAKEKFVSDKNGLTLCECGHTELSHDSKGCVFCTGGIGNKVCAKARASAKEQDCACGHSKGMHSTTTSRCHLYHCACEKYVKGESKPLEDAVVHGSIDTKDDKWWGSNYGFGGSTIGSYNKFCGGHKPQKLIQGNGWSVSAGTKYQINNEVYSYDVLLNCSNSGPLMYNHKIPFKWWDEMRQGFKQPLEVELDWPDRGEVDLPAEFWLQLKRHLEKEKQSMLVFCVGGHGRTGTAVACLMVASGYAGDEAIAWVRKNYCEDAIESKEQEKYVQEIYKDMKALVKFEQKSKKEKKQDKKEVVKVREEVTV